MCQCCTTPAALAAKNTFFVRALVPSGGRNRNAVVGNATFDPLCKLNAMLPFVVLNTRIAPSPHPAAK
jgi:hypothetical protein